MSTSNTAYRVPPQAQFPYPPTTASTPSLGSPRIYNKIPDDVRRINRTPSPTPSEEAELLRDSLLDWKSVMNWRFWFRREWLCARFVLWSIYSLRLLRACCRVLRHWHNHCDYYDSRVCFPHTDCTFPYTRYQLDAWLKIRVANTYRCSLCNFFPPCELFRSYLFPTFHSECDISLVVWPRNCRNIMWIGMGSLDRFWHRSRRYISGWNW